MNGIDFLAETNFLIHLNQGEPFVESFLDYGFAVSFITEIELLDDCLVLDMNYQIKQKCIYIRKKYKIKIPDAIIASTAIVYNIPLITSDKGFDKIKEIDLLFIQK
ncbi:type II toxin-antitoxin system VapC family toxin [Flavobacterium sp. ZT3R18]|uniref:PIN domain-containing protein n=1 Tax=Flavobacterium sp. ZT3R18 TaxID=2594429 RepID=UPI001179C356|nr:PIN domain-containing protein [Flavobacterium sp. ZT3R18]TRX32071.1 type II toxin-antitoxin system VapC family toxin [Flavobacterium sp. ZT3R18]